MQDKSSQAILLRTFTIMLFMVALGMMGAQVFRWFEVPTAIPISLMTVGIASLVIAQSVSKSSDQTD
ncbi:MAG: hypothetical protein MUF47_13900 [Porphyrobacter sp.]|jgi:hypothetical protein|nr:hypothetical protein [Porphyrobacter sp.]